MSPPSIIHSLIKPILILLTVFPVFLPQIPVVLPQTLNVISYPTLPNLNSSINPDPPRVAVQIDDTHNIYFTQYRLLSPSRNYFAAIVSMQTSLIAEYFSRRAETLEDVGVSLDVYGAEIYLDNPTGSLTYAMAHRVLGELGEFLMEGNRCTARFELWEVRGGENVRQLSVGWLVEG